MSAGVFSPSFNHRSIAASYAAGSEIDPRADPAPGVDEDAPHPEWWFGEEGRSEEEGRG